MSLDIYNKAGASDEVPVFVFLIICFRIGKMFCARGFSMFLRALYSFFCIGNSVCLISFNEHKSFSFDILCARHVFANSGSSDHAFR